MVELSLSFQLLEFSPVYLYQTLLIWRRSQVMISATNEISGDLRSVADDARHGGHLAPSP